MSQSQPKDLNTRKYLWMMGYCEKYGLSPEGPGNWEHAERKWNEFRQKELGGHAK